MSSHVDFAVVPPGVDGVNANHPCRSGARVLDAEAGLVERIRDRLAIVGYATSSRDLAPFDDSTFEIVGLNQLYRMIPRADFWCDIHSNWNEENVEGTDHKGWLAHCNIPVLMTETVPGIPTSVKFPLDEIISRLGLDYFTSTISYLVAWGIYQGYREIALYGIDLVVGSEYESQKACAEAWLGIAHGRGVTVRLPQQCALLKHSHRYGYQREPDWGLASQREFTDRVTSLTKQRDTLVAKLHALDGAIHEVTKRTDWDSDPAKRLDWLHEQRGETMAALATMDGAAQESSYWRDVFQLRSRGADIRLR